MQRNQRHDSQPQHGPALVSGRLILPILLFVLLGIPLVAYLWDALNQLFAGEFDGPRLLFAALALFGLFLLLRILGRTVARWEGTRFD